MIEPSLLLLARAGDPVIETLRPLLPRRLVHADIADLSSAGWQYVVGRPDLATACARGRVLTADHIAAVLCRISTVLPGDVQHLHVDDRAFAAAEMNAFLRAWLAQYKGVRFNEPNSTSLAGPAWHAMRWRWLAAQLGVPSVAASFFVVNADLLTLLVAGDRVIGTEDPMLVRYSLRIARAVRSSLLALRFLNDAGWRFESADSCPPLDRHCAAQLIEWALRQPTAAPPHLRTAG